MSENDWLWNLDLTLQHAVIHVRKQKRRDVLTSTAAVIRDALSRSHSCHTAVWQEKNILYIHMHWQMLTKWSLSELCECSLHNKTQKCSKKFPILMPKYKQCYKHTTVLFSSWVRRHPLIGKMRPVTLYWHFSPENTRPGKHKHWLARRALALMLRWDHSHIRFPSYFSGWLD